MPYPAKVLLFGEHTVLRGSRGLAMPYPRFSLDWVTDQRPDRRLQQFATYLHALPTDWLDTPRMIAELAQGLRLGGNIPTGYGLGSSGAVCAAVLDRYGLLLPKKPGTRDLRQLLVRMEGFFHGQSSGTDPLISYLKQPLLLHSGADAGAINLPEGWQTGMFLVDTGVTREASPLIEKFLEAFDTRAVPNIEEGWIAPVEMAITALLTGEREVLYTAFASISDFQLTHFPSFIPERFRALWDGGERYRLKLCGAGGGGMLLGLARDRVAAEGVFGDRLQWL